MPDFQDQLDSFPKRRQYLICLDSDGTVFDTAGLKNKECFIPNIIKHWRLQAAAGYVRETAEYVSLYSPLRGANRFVALVAVFDLLGERPEVLRRGAEIPPIPALRRWIQSSSALSNPALRAAAEQTGSPELHRVLVWSEAVNRDIAEMVRGLPPFPLVRECLAEMAGWADILVCSTTPTEALEREWSENGIRQFAGGIAGQEFGPKTLQIARVAAGRYDPRRILVIGDSPGDEEAARNNGAAFFPVLAGDEESSWAELASGVLLRFREHGMAPAEQQAFSARFRARLSPVPPWKRQRQASVAREG